MRSARRLLGLSLLVGLCPVGGCFTFQGALREFDAVTRLDVDPQLQTGRKPVQFTNKPQRHRWGIRNLEGTGVDQAWIWLFDVDPVEIEISNPSEFARERLDKAVEKAGDDLAKVALVAQRVHLIASSGQNGDKVGPLNRVQALRHCGDLLGRLGIDPLGTLQARRLVTIDPRLLAPGWPDGTQDRDPEIRRRHLIALYEVSRAPADDVSMQRQLMRLLANAARIERDPVVRRASRWALLRVVDFALSDRLLQALLRPDRTSRERETAFQQLRTLGGPASVPTLLALLAGGQRDVRYLERLPLDLRRTVVAACARLRGPLVEARFTISSDGRLGPAPVQILYDVALNDYDRGLRAIALEGLAFALGRPRDPSTTWAREWYAEWALRNL